MDKYDKILIGLIFGRVVQIPAQNHVLLSMISGNQKCKGAVLIFIIDIEAVK